MAELKHPDLVYYVGMSRGEDTEFYLKKGYRVVGFEADPLLVDHCRKRFAAALADGQLNIVAGVICPDPPASGSVAFYRSTNDQWGTARLEWAERNQQLGSSSSVIQLETVDFAGCLAKFGIPHYMKIDIEGADLVCAKMLLQFTERPDYLSIESTKTDFSALLGEFDLLSKLGYSRFAVVQQQTIDGRSYKGQSLIGNTVRHVFPRGASGPSVPRSRSRICRRLKRSGIMNAFFGCTDYSATTRPCGGTSLAGSSTRPRRVCRNISEWRYLAGMTPTRRCIESELHAASRSLCILRRTLAIRPLRFLRIPS
jgi:methyltransferase FkbM-like protein